mgnify:CR=1 FL=1|jgi:hypothetical protein
MTSSIHAYDHAWRLTKTGVIDVDTDELRIALVTSAYSPNPAHTQWADVSAFEVAAGNGYTTGGARLLAPVVTNSKITYTNPTWPSLTKVFRYGVCRAVKTVAGLTDPLLFWVLFNTEPADEIQNSANFEIKINPTDGLFYRPG